MTNEELEALLDGLNFELEPIFVIKTLNAHKKWYVHHIEFINGDSIIRTIYWTPYQTESLHFHDWDEASAFALSQFGARKITVKEII